MRDVVFRPVEAIPVVVELSGPLHALGGVGIGGSYLAGDLGLGAVAPAFFLLPGQLVRRSIEW